MTHADHIPQREAVGAEGGKPDARKQRRAPAAGEQIVPEKGNDPDKPQRCRRPEACGWALAEEDKAVDGVIQHGHRENHRLKAGIDMGGGGVKAPEVETENAAALKHAVEMIPQRQPAQAAKGDQDDHHRGAGHGEAPENGDRRCNRPLL